MKQFQFTFKDEETLDLELMKNRKWSMSNLYSVLLIRFYTEILDRGMIEHACVKIREQLPNAMPCLAIPNHATTLGTRPILWVKTRIYYIIRQKECQSASQSISSSATVSPRAISASAASSAATSAGVTLV